MCASAYLPLLLHSVFLDDLFLFLPCLSLSLSLQSLRLCSLSIFTSSFDHVSILLPPLQLFSPYYYFICLLPCCLSPHAALRSSSNLQHLLRSASNLARRSRPWKTGFELRTALLRGQGREQLMQRYIQFAVYAFHVHGHVLHHCEVQLAAGM